MRLIRWLALFLVAVPILVVAQGVAQGEPLGAEDARSVRQVVESQLKALAEGRAGDAFAFASPSIQRQFGDAAGFAEMVERSYPMLVHPASIGFFVPSTHHGAVLQAVHFRDVDGHLWRAVYELERQPDRSWRIDGCVVSPDNESSTT